MRAAPLVLTLLVTVAVPIQVSAGKCAGEATSLVLSTRDVTIPGDGGVLVATTTIGLGGQGGAADAMNPSWRFHDDEGGEHVPTLVSLAPGLVSYRPPAAAFGRLRLASGNTELLSFRRETSELPPLGAPSVKRVRAGGRQTVTVDVRKTAPPEVVAIVVLAVTKQGNVARSWAPMGSGDKSVIVYQAPGRCEPPIPGATPARAGEKVVVAWVDKAGRLSKTSAPIRVGK